MNVIVDGQANFEVQGDPDNVLAVIAAASEYLHDQKRAILSVKIDGQPVAYTEMVEELKNKSLDSVETLTIVSEEVNLLVKSCLDELEQALPDLPTACHDLAEVFQGAEPELGYEPFYQLAEIWGTVKTRQAQVASALEIDLESLTVGAVPFKDLHEELNKYLSEAVEALETADCVLLGDLLEYELAPRAETEAAIVSLLQEQAGLQTQG